MIHLIVAKNTSDKKEVSVKKRIIEDQKKNNSIQMFFEKDDEFSKETGNIIYLDQIMPTLSDLSYRDIAALNAGYLDGSRCLADKAREVIADKEKNNGENRSFSEVKDTPYEGLLEESLERVLNAWEEDTLSNGEVLRKRMKMKTRSNQVGIDEAVEKIKQSRKVRIRSKALYSSQKLAIIFILMSRLSIENNVTLYGHSMSFLKKGNLSFFNNINPKYNASIVMTLNKLSNVSINMHRNFETIDMYGDFQKKEVEIGEKIQAKSNCDFNVISEYNLNRTG